MAVVLFSSTVGTLLAGTTGTISGTITDAKTNAPLAGVRVAAVSPTGNYSTTTNAKGFYGFNGVSPDTYTVSFELPGFQPQSLTGVNVFADQTATVSQTLTKSLVTIGRVTARSAGGAFQPTQTQDTYTVTSQQIQTVLGKSDALSESNLLTRLPGASLDKYGYPVLRGGRENEEGFQFEGIDYVDAFTSQFTNSLALNSSVGQLQLVPGAGDVTQGNAGTGVINLIAKKGTYPAFGSVDVETLLQPFTHQASFEYGFATPNGAISNYFSFTGLNSDAQFGARGVPAQSLSLSTAYYPSAQTDRDITDNLIFKFGRDKNQQFQVFYDNQQYNFRGAYGGYGTLSYPGADPYFLANASALTGLTTPQIDSLLTLVPGQPSVTAALDRGPTNTYQPNNVIKFQYSNNLNSTTFLTAKYYQLDSVVNFDYPNNDEGVVFAGSFDALQGGHRTGAAIDLSSQLNSHNLVSVGAKYDFLHPVYNQVGPTDGLFAAGSAFITGVGGYEIADFVSPTDPNCPLGPGACGYLYNYFANPGPIPYNNEQTVTNRQDYAFYVRDKLSPSDRLNVDFGIRVDGTHYQAPGLNGCNPANYDAYFTPGKANDQCQYAPTSFRTVTDPSGNPVQLPVVSVPNAAISPIIPEPRIAVSFQATKNDAFRASFARSVELAPLAFVDLTVPEGTYSRFKNVPSFDVLTGAPAMYCGVLANQPCSNYADQLRWSNQNYLEGVPIQPVKPETFTNYDFSYSRQFPNGISAKITPFYRRGYDALALVSQPIIDPATGLPQISAATGSIILGPSLATNLGQSRTTGVEFYVTREAAYGLSGQFSATYLNEFSNVVPSPLIQEDFFPPIPPQSLALGNQYRVGFVSPLSASLALSYKTHAGFRFNPIVTYNRGYPIGVGNINAAYVGGKAVNIPNTNTPEASAFGTNYSPNYVDPQNPGTLFKPNIAASRGTPETASAAGVLANARFNTSASFEYTKPGSRSTVGILVSNLFNQLYSSNNTYNSRYQPVATGISGPKTGYSTVPVLYPNLGFQQYLPFQFGQDPYRLVPNATPQTVRLYYQLAL